MRMGYEAQCGAYPCTQTTGGCNFPCPYRLSPGVHYTVPMQVPPMMMSHGCICPPTSEKTCESVTCPRKNHALATGTQLR
jgi:hypothetical protein